MTKPVRLQKILRGRVLVHNGIKEIVEALEDTNAELAQGYIEDADRIIEITSGLAKFAESHLKNGEAT